MFRLLFLVFVCMSLIDFVQKTVGVGCDFLTAVTDTLSLETLSFDFCHLQSRWENQLQVSNHPDTPERGGVLASSHENLYNEHCVRLFVLNRSS